VSVKIGQLGDHYDPTIDPRFSKVGKQVCKDTGPLTKARMVTSRSRPLLALSGHSNDTSECPLLGVKQTSRFALQMSAFDPKRTSSNLFNGQPDHRPARHC
jgi:hypothetical protein